MTKQSTKRPKRTKRQSTASVAVILILMAVALIGIVLLKKFTGYAAVTAQAGYIVTLDIVHKQDTIHWQGYYGLALMETGFNDTQTATAMPSGVDEKHLIFNCLQPSVQHEVYAAAVDLNSLNWNNILAGTAQMVDDYLNISANSTDSAANTFNRTDYYVVSGNNITSVPTTYTYINSAANTTRFPTGVLNVSGQLVFVSKVSDAITTNYKGGSSNYQLIVAVPNTTVTYYFARDPGDTCPSGLKSGVIGEGFITGYATNNATGQPMANVTISVSSIVNTTDPNGFFNVTVQTGYHRLIGSKEGFSSHIGAANVSLLETTWHNFSLTEFRGPHEGNGTIKGTARDNSTNATLEGVMVSVAGRTAFSDQNGNYSMNATIGEHILIAVKSSYQNYIDNVTVNFSNTTQHNIYLAPLTGTLEGFAFRSDTGAALEDVTVTAAGQATTTNSTGRYSLSIAPGTHTVSATKTSFSSDAGQTNVTAGLRSFMNFTLTPSSGTLYGTVLDNATNSTINGSRVYIANNLILTSAGGNFTATLASGAHVLWVIKEGYETFTENVTVVGLATTNMTVRLRPTNGTLAGNVTDSATAQAISNATVSIAGTSVLTNSNGSYNLTILTGTHVFAAVKPGYENTVGNATIEPGRATTKNIQMTPLNITPQAGTGYVQGKATDESGAALGNVSVSVAGQTNLTNSSGHYLINATAGVHNLAATKSGYQTYASAVTVNASNTTTHNFNMSLAVTQGQGTGLGAGVGAGLGAGGGAGKGAGTGVSKPTQQPSVIEKEGTKKMLDVSRILKRLSQGTFTTVPIRITNYRNTPVFISLGVTGEVAPMSQIDKTAMVIGPGEKAEATLTLLATAEPGLYNGSLQITGDAEESVPIDLLITEKGKLPIETLNVKIEVFDRQVGPGTPLKFRVDLQNLLKAEEYMVKLSYSIKQRNSDSSYQLGEEEIMLRASKSLLKDFIIPEEAETGDYLLIVDAEYITFYSSHTAAFSVALPLYRYSFFGILPLWAIAVTVLVLSTGTFSVVTYQKQKAKKRRYQVQLDYKSMPKAGPRSACVGKVAETPTRAYFDLDQFQTHTLIAGSSGSGKTVTAAVLVEEALMKGVSVMVFDPTAQWTGFLRKNTDKKMLATYGQFGLKLSEAKGFNGNVRQILDKNEVVDIKKFMKPSEITVFAINKLEPEDIDVIVANTVKQVFKARLPESKELRLVMVFDEVHRLLPKFGGSGQGFLQIERATREFRKWGIGLFLISQVLTDFMGEIKANINTEIQMRTRDEKDMKRVEEAYGVQILKSVVKAAVGTGMVENSSYNRGKPFFVAFRPLLHNHAALSDGELEGYNKYNSILDELDYQLEQLRQEGVDVFDVELELKLAKDKLKTGNFSMVDIYMDSLKPRITDEWRKIGKEPKHYKAELPQESEKSQRSEESGEEQTGEGEKRGEREEASGALTAKAKELIAEINSSITGQKVAEAKQLYAQLSEYYKTMDKEQKASVYDDVISLRQRLQK